jgi:hypothetical protein
VLQEVLGKLAEMGQKTVLIPMRSAVMAIQGFQEKTLQQHVITEAERNDPTNSQSAIALIDDMNRQARAAQSTVDFYEKTIRGFLKEEKYKFHTIQRGENVQGEKLEYLSVDLTDPRSSLVVHWDRENPAAPSIPLAHTQESAGVQSQEQIQGSITAWDAQGTESIFFKRWWGQGKLVNADSKEPLKYWYRAGDVSLIGETPVYALHSNWRNPAWGMQDIRDLRDYYVKVENPMRVEYPKQVLTDADMQSLVTQAQAGGFDGIVLKKTGLPFDSNQVLVWNPEQLADGQLSAVPERTYFDLESPAQAKAHGTLTGSVKEFLGHWIPGVAMAGKLSDVLVQIQQRAIHPLYGDVFDQALQHMNKLINLAGNFKSQLQVQGEKVVKGILALGIAKQNLIEGFLQAEWKAGEHWTALAEDSTGNLRYQPSPLFREQLVKHGIDPATVEGTELAKLILDYKNGAQMQLNALQQILIENAVSKYAGNDLVIARVVQKIRQTFTKLQSTPFMPQGHFGQYVVIVRESLKKNGKKYVPVHVEHFEDEKSYNKARTHWLSKQDANPQQYKVETKEIKDFNGIPTNLPANILENFQDTGLFSEEQLDTVMELMQPDLVDRVVKKFEDATSKLDGASKDFIRNYADFIWHNSNFTWKLRYRKDFSQAIQWQQHEIRELHKAHAEGLPAAERVKIIALRERNLKMMEETKSYLLYPTQEFQTARLAVTLLMLGYNFMSAAMNTATLLNTAAAVTTEYGELAGTQHMTKAMDDLIRYKLDTAGWQTEAKDNVEMQRRMGFSATMDAALRDGVIDQTYSALLAGQSTSSAILRHFRRTTMGHMSRQFLQGSMVAFQSVEKVNRAWTLMTFYNAEMARLKKLGIGAGLAQKQAYETAQRKTLLLQNAYDSGNRPSFLRGKKAIFFVFMSYVQFMTWLMSGGYERGQRAQFRAEGRAVRPVMFGTTMKLWLMFLLLSGVEGLPGFGNLLDILQAIWRKLSGGENLRLEMRKFFNEIGLDSNLVMGGLLHDIGGMNLSSRFGLGDILPGTELLNRQADKPLDLLGEGVLDVSGPAGGALEGLVNVGLSVPAMIAGHKTVAETAKEVPGVLGSIGKAVDAHQKQSLRPTYGVTTKGGERMTRDLETGEFRDLTDAELVKMALGGRSSMVAQNQERKHSQNGEVIYWQTRRAKLLDLYKTAVWQKDKEKRDAATAAIAEYNAQVPAFNMQITVKNRLDSVRAMRKKNMKLDRGEANERRYRGIIRDVDEAF